MNRFRLTALAVAVLCAASGAARAAEDSNAAVPVTPGTVEAKDVPVYVRGLGTVQAYNAVTIKSRVDGQIMQVFFTEGQDVKQGDRLFQIDPRPYQAALDQAQAAKVKDEAALHSAQLDLDRYAALVGKGFQTRQSYDQQKATVESDQASVVADQALIDSAKLNVAYADIRAPFDGRTGARLVEPGQPRPGLGRDGARHHHPDQADLRQLHGSAGPAGRDPPEPVRRRAGRRRLQQR